MTTLSHISSGNVEQRLVDWGNCRFHVAPGNQYDNAKAENFMMTLKYEKVLMVDYLDNHLREVIARHEDAPDGGVLGLGTGLDFSPYYRHCLAMDLSVAPTMAMFGELVRWDGGRRHAVGVKKPRGIESMRRCFDKEFQLLHSARAEKNFSGRSVATAKRASWA